MAGSPRFRHLDDLPWQEVRRQQHGDHTASVWEKWPEFDRYLTVYARYDPGMIVQPHGHNSDHVVFVIEGDIMCGETYCPAGTHIALDQGDVFGPFLAGPWVRALRDHDGRPAVVPGDHEEYQKFLADQGVVPLPNPADRHACRPARHAQLRRARTESGSIPARRQTRRRGASRLSGQSGSTRPKRSANRHAPSARAKRCREYRPAGIGRMGSSGDVLTSNTQ